MSAEPYLGQIELFGFNFVPEGWVSCDGSLLPIYGNEALYAVIGTTYGGNGQSNFGVPDLRGRVPIGQGAGKGLSPRSMGEKSGAETVSLTAANMPVHTHTAACNNTAGGSLTPLNMFPGLSVSTVGDSPYATAVTQAGTMNAGMITANPGGAAHSNMQVSMALNYCMAVQGLYPSAS